MRAEQRRFPAHPRIGIAQYDECNQDIRQMLTHAGAAMHSVQLQARTRVRVYEPEDHEIVRRRLKIVDQLYTALDAEEFEIHHQPEFLVEQFFQLTSTDLNRFMI